MVVFTNEAFGAKLLEAVTAGLYDGNLNCLREYTQNSIDSRGKKIEVDFENGHTDLLIKDDGRGMDEKELERALYLGVSEKSALEIGWRGIGIWSGIPACRRIVIVTKKQNNPKLRVEINADRLRDQYTSNIPAIEVLSNITGKIENIELGLGESLQESHFTVVRLEEMLPNQRTIFREERIREYLSKNVPAPFDLKNFKLGDEINRRLLSNGIKTAMPEILFENQKIFRPPYTDDIFFPNISEKTFIVNDKVVAYGWLLTSKNNQQLKQPNKGIYFKKKGITIGDENLIARQFEGIYNYWQYGEIHILADELKENAPRNNFEANNDVIDPFFEQVGGFIKDLQGQNKYQSQKVVTRSVDQIEKLIDVGDHKQARERIKKVKKKLQQQRSFPKEPAIQEMKEVIDKKSEEDKTKLGMLERKISKLEEPSDLIKEKRERFNEFIKTSHPLLKEHLDKTTTKGKMELDISAMDPVMELLRQKTGLKEQTLHDMSRRTFDWKDVTKGDNGPMLSFSTPYRGRNFGVMIYALEDLFVNPFKHEKGKKTFAYYESMTEEEKIDTITEFNMAQNLVLRLIEKSKLIRAVEERIHQN